MPLNLPAGLWLPVATIGFLIPPSLGFVVFGMLTEQSIGKLLISGILPGIVLSLHTLLLVIILVKMDPSLAPRTPGDVTFKEKLIALKGDLGNNSCVLHCHWWYISWFYKPYRSRCDWCLSTPYHRTL